MKILTTELVVILLLILGVTVMGIVLNYEKISDSDYYVFHPHPDDTCEELLFKYDLYHPQGSNPVRFENLRELFIKNCITEIELK